MAIPFPLTFLLFEEGRRNPFKGNLLQLGKQDFFFNYKDLQRAARDDGVALKSSKAGSKISEVAPEKCNPVDGNLFFEELGFENVHSLDASGYEGADILFDLNRDSPPQSLQNRFDVILDVGTLEHIFHLPNALKNIHSFLKTGGRIIHAAPVNHYFDHGFYSFSPCFFHDYYAHNRFEIHDSRLIRFHPSHLNSYLEVLDCKVHSPELNQLKGIGTLDDRVYALWVVAEKTRHSTVGEIPQQSHYRSLWDNRSSEETPPSVFPPKKLTWKRIPKSS